MNCTELRRFHYDDLDDGIGDDSIDSRRRRERWDTVEWSTIINVRTGVPSYDPFLDWILNAPDTMTYTEWWVADRPLAIHATAAPVGPSNRTERGRSIVHQTQEGWLAAHPDYRYSNDGDE